MTRKITTYNPDGTKTITKPTKEKYIFLSWIEEFWPGQREDVILGRVEVERPGDLYPSEEIRFVLPNTQSSYAFRDKWDFKYVSEKELLELKASFKAIMNDYKPEDK
jgi:hypothetical protein